MKYEEKGEDVSLFLDHQSLGLRRFLEKEGIQVRDITEILGHKDTRHGVSDDAIIDYLLDKPKLTLVTKDKGLGKKAKENNLSVILVDETEVVANNVIRRWHQRASRKKSKIFIPSRRPEDWKELLADPEGHWKVGKSAYEIAHCWEKEPTKFPKNIRSVFRKSAYPVFKKATLLFAYPEFKVRLDTARAPSQNDVFALATSDQDLISIAVEGKAGEDFDKQIVDWLKDKSESSGKPDRLEYLSNMLGLEQSDLENIRYQLLHRTASAIIEAKKYDAKHAIMIVQNFHSEMPHFDDYRNFAELLGLDKEITSKTNSVEFVKRIDNIAIYLAWINDH